MTGMSTIPVSNGEIRTVRDGMRDLHRLVEQLEAGTLTKVVFMNRKRMAAVLVSVEEYARLVADTPSNECAACGRFACYDPYTGDLRGFMVPQDSVMPQAVPACDACGGRDLEIPGPLGA
jgi:hypothetical protein